MGKTQQQANEQSLQPIKDLLEKKRQARKSLQGFMERNKGQRIGVQVNVFNGPEHVCVGFSHPDDVESMTTKVLDTIESQIAFFEQTIDKLTK